MKKVLAFALTLGMILAMAACGSEPAGTGTKPAEAKAQPAKTDMGYAETKPNGAGNADSLYMDRKYPVIRTQVTDEVREAEGLTVTLEKIEFRKGLTLCFFRIINEREDGRSARIIALRSSGLSCVEPEPGLSLTSASTMGGWTPASRRRLAS